MVKMEIKSKLLPMGIEEFKNSLKKRKMSPETIRGYSTDLKQFAHYQSTLKNGPVYIDEITADDVASFHQQFIDQNASSATLRRKLNAVSSFFSYAVRQGWAFFNPTESYKL